MAGLNFEGLSIGGGREKIDTMENNIPIYLGRKWEKSCILKAEIRYFWYQK